MAGLDSNTPLPTRLVLHKVSRLLEIDFADGRSFKLPFELMRVYSPSAEVRGHGPGQETLQTGKAEVGIDSLEQVGHYAIQPQFSDGHSSGIFSWDYLYWLGDQQEALWADYLARLEAAAGSRYPSPVTDMASMAVTRQRGGGCG
ncbi:MAG: hypothetical protein RI906_1557 [Pseudomonadota bacterium]|jgi:DUF971 family protein